MSKHGYNFLNAQDLSWLGADVDRLAIIFRQQPKQARVCNSRERERRWVEPPPIIQVKMEGADLDAQRFLQNPFIFMLATLVSADGENHRTSGRNSACPPLTGGIVSSLYRLKDVDNSDAGFFVFPELSVRVEGWFRLKFSLYSIASASAAHLNSVYSDPFFVYSHKDYPGACEPTFLSRSIADQGVKLRLRKEQRVQKRPSHSRDLRADSSDGGDYSTSSASLKRKHSSMSKGEEARTDGFERARKVSATQSLPPPPLPKHERLEFGYPSPKTPLTGSPPPLSLPCCSSSPAPKVAVTGGLVHSPLSSPRHSQPSPLPGMQPTYPPWQSPFALHPPPHPSYHPATHSCSIPSEPSPPSSHSIVLPPLQSPKQVLSLPPPLLLLPPGRPTQPGVRLPPPHLDLLPTPPFSSPSLKLEKLDRARADPLDLPFVR
ncbi:uncharacterized protein VTP21DRAFT_10908 [Calcarisporiella thermophila]|uniref:uncharacterized protein n=1 Tax=Calcarisporiella thermophila TaxID=911321 RepID=UPI003743D0B5